MVKQFYPCGLSQYQLTIQGGHPFTTKNGMVSLDRNMASVSCASSSHMEIRDTAAKKPPAPISKILLLGAPTLKCCSQNGL